MRHAVRADNSCTVDAEDNWQVGNRDVVHHLVDGTLEKSRIDGDHGAHPACGKSAGERDHVAFRYADVEESVGEPRSKAGKPRAVAHRRSQRDDAVVVLGKLAQRIAEGIAPSRHRR